MLWKGPQGCNLKRFAFRNRLPFLRPRLLPRSIVICGHVDSGKSTATGRLLFELGGMPSRELDKLRAEAERRGKASFAFAFFMDRRAVLTGFLQLARASSPPAHLSHAMRRRHDGRASHARRQKDERDRGLNISCTT